MNKSVLSNCEQCGGLHVSRGGNTCKPCKEKNHETLQSVCKYLDQNPKVSVEDLISNPAFPADSIRLLVKDGKLSGYSNLKMQCRLCKKEMSATSRRIICYKCYIELAQYTSSEKKIEMLRQNLRQRDQIKREGEKQEKLKTAPVKKYGFKSTFNEQLARYTEAIEPEFFPDTIANPNLKLSNRLRLSPVMVYT
jgi:hypothetical protein